MIRLEAFSRMPCSWSNKHISALVTWSTGDSITVNKQLFKPVMVVNTFNSSLWVAEAGRFCEFETSLVYRASSRTVRTPSRGPVSKQNRKKEKKHTCRYVRGSRMVAADVARKEFDEPKSRWRKGPNGRTSCVISLSWKPRPWVFTVTQSSVPCEVVGFISCCVP